MFVLGFVEDSQLFCFLLSLAMWRQERSYPSLERPLANKNDAENRNSCAVGGAARAITQNRACHQRLHLTKSRLPAVTTFNGFIYRLLIAA